MCNQKNHYFIDCKNEKTKKRLKKLDVNQVFIDSMLHMKSHKLLKKDKFLMSALHR